MITILKLKSKKLFLGEEIKQKETQIGAYRGSLRLIPPRGLKKIRGQKRTITSSKLKSKKLLLGEDIKHKETQMGPHRGSLS